MRVFHWAMRYGSMILFLFALWEVIAGVVEVWSRWETLRVSEGAFSGAPASPGVRLVVSVHYLSFAVVPFLGSLIVYRIDRWLNSRVQPEPKE